MLAIAIIATGMILFLPAMAWEQLSQAEVPGWVENVIAAVRWLGLAVIAAGFIVLVVTLWIAALA